MVVAFETRNAQRPQKIMSLTNFFRGSLFHFTAASLVLAVILLIAEILVPSSVLPFIDVIDFLPWLMALVAAIVIITKLRTDNRQQMTDDEK